MVPPATSVASERTRSNCGGGTKVGLPSLSYLISLFIVGYGLAHIPGGMLATAIGMKRTLVIGLTVQGAAGVMSGLSYSYLELEWFRLLSGIGGSVLGMSNSPAT